MFRFLMPHCRLLKLILQIDLENTLETMSTKLLFVNERYQRMVTYVTVN